MARRSPSAEEPWYAGGLRFRCTACGVCCTGAPGYVWITDDDVERMASALGITPRKFRRTYVRKAKGQWSLRERENGDCILLQEGKCSVYGAKPLRCSTFPFWSEVLSDPDEWTYTKQRCEGIDEGDRYSRDEIERLLAGDSGPLLEKHARPVSEDDAVASPAWEAAFEDLERLYRELERELPRYGFTCAASGRCCDFDAFGHRLYASTLEAEYFFRHPPASPWNPDESQCPAWGDDRLCKARQGRMLGCRTFFCGPYPVMPPDDIYERYHKRLEALHLRHGIPYRYADIRAWTNERRTAP